MKPWLHPQARGCGSGTDRNLNQANSSTQLSQMAWKLWDPSHQREEMPNNLGVGDVDTASQLAYGDLFAIIELAGAAGGGGLQETHIRVARAEGVAHERRLFMLSTNFDQLAMRYLYSKQNSTKKLWRGRYQRGLIKKRAGNIDSC